MAKYNFAVDGLSVAEIEQLVSDATGLANTASSSTLKQIDQAITAAGQEACRWRGNPWWFLQDFGQFDTHTKTVETIANSGAKRATNVVTITTIATHGLQVGQTVKISVTSDSGFDGIFRISAVNGGAKTFTYWQRGDAVGNTTAGGGTINVISYPLRSIAVDGLVASTDTSKVFWTARTFSSVAYDDTTTGWNLSPIPWHRMRTIHRVSKTQGATTPNLYTLSGDEPLLYLWPPPDTTYTIICDFLERHSEIIGGDSGAEDAALIIPKEYHRGVYVDGAIWLLRNGVTETSGLDQCPGFLRAMEAMQESHIRHADLGNQDDMFPDAQGGVFPNDRRVDIIDGEVGIWNDGSI